MSIVNIVGGTLLLAFGRKIFWLFVAATGFFAGFELATRFLNLKPAWVALVIALAIGLLGALLAYFFQSLAIGAAGFFAGLYITSRLAYLLPAQAKSWEWLVILIGGIIGIVLMYIIFEWALIILSSLAGAILVVNGFKLAGLIGTIVGVVLFAAGLIFQASLNRRDHSRKEATTKA
jgi:hypothetical protein